MPAGTGTHRDQAIDAGVRGLARMPHVDDVVKHQPAVTLHGADQLLYGSERGDDQRHLVPDGNLEVRLQSRIALVHN